MAMNVLVIGAGYFSQRIHINILKNNKKIGKIFIYDERVKLAEKVAKRFNLEILKTFNFSEINKNKIKVAILCFVRDLSFFYASKALKFNLHLLAEKPVVQSRKNLEKLISTARKKKKIFQICYQKTFSPAIKFLSQNVKKLEKIYGTLRIVIFELFNGDMRNGTRSFCRTKEKINYINRDLRDEKKLKLKENKVRYQIFLNRYIHSINLFNYLFNFTKFKIEKFKIISKYNFFLQISKKNTQFVFNFGDYNFHKWHDKIILYFEKAKLIIELKAPLDFSKPKLSFFDGIKRRETKIKTAKNNLFKDQLNFFFNSIKRGSTNNNYEIYKKDYMICDSLWSNK